MSAVFVLADDLRERIARDLHQMAIEHPRSLPAQVRGECWDQVVEYVARTIDLEIDDFEVALIAALGRAREGNVDWFIQRRSTRADAFLNFWKKPA